MQVAKAFVGARGVDSYPFSMGGTAAQAKALKASGVDFFVGYLGVMNSARLGYVLDAGLAFMPVTLANRWDGKQAVDQAKALGLPAGTCIWFDLEGKSVDGKDWTIASPAERDAIANTLIAKLTAWAMTVAAAGYLPCLYVGSPQPLTGDELYKLPFVRYWKAPSRVFDRYGKAWDGPGQAGFCMWQMWPQGNWQTTGVFVDVNIIGQDFKGRVPTWVVK